MEWCNDYTVFSSSWQVEYSDIKYSQRVYLYPECLLRVSRAKSKLHVISLIWPLVILISANLSVANIYEIESLLSNKHNHFL